MTRKRTRVVGPVLLAGLLAVVGLCGLLAMRTGQREPQAPPSPSDDAQAAAAALSPATFEPSRPNLIAAPRRNTTLPGAPRRAQQPAAAPHDPRLDTDEGTSSDAGLAAALPNDIGEAQQRWEKEVIDEAWTQEIRQGLTETFEDLKIPGEVTSVSCRMSLCRINLEVDGRDGLALLQDATGGESDRRWTKAVGEDDHWFVDAFFHR